MKKYKVECKDFVVIGEKHCEYTTNNRKRILEEVIQIFFSNLNWYGLSIPNDLVIKNGKDKITIEYSFKETDEITEKVCYEFKITEI